MSSTLRGGALEWNSSITSRRVLPRFNFDDSSYSAFSASRTYAPFHLLPEQWGKIAAGKGRGNEIGRKPENESLELVA